MDDNSFYVITKDKFFQVLSDFSIVEITDYASHSDFERFVYPYFLEINSSTDPIELTKKMMNSIIKYSTESYPTYYIFNTKDNAFQFFKGES